MKRVVGLFTVLVIIIATSGCTKETHEMENVIVEDVAIENTAKNNTIVTVDQSKMIEYPISSEDGGVISISYGDNARIDIGFMAGAVDKDVVFEVSPTNLLPGFYLEEKGLVGGIDLKMPASICYVTSDEIPKDTVIVKYHDDGKGYSVVPTQQVQMSGVNGLIAFVDGFSGYGVKSVTQSELDKMANDFEKSGFDWVLRIDDNTQELVGTYMSYEVLALIEMRNTEAPNPRVMQGTYRGQAVMREFVDITFEGLDVYSMIEGSDREVEFTLHPIFEIYEPEPDSGLPMLCGLVAESYAGKGVLNLIKEISGEPAIGSGGTNILDIVDPLANQWGVANPKVTQMEIPFTVKTDGPMAYFTYHIEQVGAITLTGSIIGYPKVPQRQSDKLPEPFPEIELEPLRVDKKPENQNTKPEIEDDYTDYDFETEDDDMDYDFETKNDYEEDSRFHENEDGSVDYDADGDGEPDIRLSPLIVKL